MLVVGVLSFLWKMKGANHMMLVCVCVRALFVEASFVLQPLKLIDGPFSPRKT